MDAAANEDEPSLLVLLLSDHNEEMTAPNAKSRLELFLGLRPLTADEKRSRRRLIRVVVYADEALLLALLLTFSKQWAIIIGSWLVINFGLITWYALYIRKTKRENRFTLSPATQSEALRELSTRLPRIILLFIISATGFIIAGFFNPLGFLAAGLMLAISLGLFIWTRRFR